MSCVIIHRPKGSGKTKACLGLVRRARAEVVSPRKGISPAVFVGGKRVGYNCLDLTSDEVFSLVRLRNLIGGPEWFFHGDLKYAFSIPVFKHGNGILTHSSQSAVGSTLLFVDKYGRLEKAGLDFHFWSHRVAEALTGGGVAVFSCRTGSGRKCQSAG